MKSPKCFASMTNVLKDISVNVNTSIILITDVGYDGIGDMIHQYRAFQILNSAFPGKIRCMTFCYPDKEVQKCEKIAEEIGFVSNFFPTYRRHDLVSALKADDVELIITISYEIFDLPGFLGPNLYRDLCSGC